jgi:circadian clock protein KaiC
MQTERVSMGIAELDSILAGGLPSNRLYVVQGEPGTGKTTLSLQFLLEGVKKGERALYITFSETKEELTSVATSHGWDISKLNLIDLSALEKQLAPESQNTLFHPSEVELNQMTDLLLKEIDRIMPARIVFDSVSEMRLLAESPLRYRRQILSLKQALVGRKATVVFLDDLTAVSQDLQVQSIAHGVLELTRLQHEFGEERRKMRVLKMRGVKFLGGYHDYLIDTGGIEVFPRLAATDHNIITRTGSLSSGIKELDLLLGGGIDYGTSNLFIGPPGTGKSTLSMKFAIAAALKGEKVVYFSFEETVANLMQRAESLGLPFKKCIENSTLKVQKVDPAELSPGQFSKIIRDLVEKKQMTTLVVDSLNGYMQAMPQEQFLVLLMHELLTYLNNKGIVTILVLAQQGMMGAHMQSPVDLTYLADTVLLTRFFEALGSVRKAVSIIKKRTGKHETTIRELMIDKEGVKVGPKLEQFQGILTGVPRFEGPLKDILREPK